MVCQRQCGSFIPNCILIDMHVVPYAISYKLMGQLSVLFLILLDIAEIDININACIILPDGLFYKVRIY